MENTGYMPKVIAQKGNILPYEASTALADPAVSAVAVVGVTSSRNQTLTILGIKDRNGAIDLMSEREGGGSWRRSITIEPNNVAALLAALTKMSKALKGNHPVAVVVIKNGVIQ